MATTQKSLSFSESSFRLVQSFHHEMRDRIMGKLQDRADCEDAVEISRADVRLAIDSAVSDVLANARRVSEPG
jgi:hypothetical protein